MWYFNKILGIKGIEIINLKNSKKEICFHIKSRRKYITCPICKRKTKRLKSLSSEKTIKNGIILSKTCLLKLRLRRFYCFNCQKTFTEEIDGLKKRQRVTINHKIEVISSLVNQSFSSITKKYKVSYHTQRRWLQQIIKSEIFNFNKEEKENTQFVLGIDEVSFAGREMMTTIGNITKHRLKGVLSSRRKDELRKLLKSLPSKVKSLISEVVIDMSYLYLKAVKETLPNVKIVVDHFHLIQDANRRIDEERRLLQDIYKKQIPRYILTKNKEDLTIQQTCHLTNLIKHYPELNIFYSTKERLREMYRLKTKDEAEKQLKLIISTLTSTDDGELISWGRTLSYWKQYILNYWNNRSTNGFMEGIHNKMKLIKRISFGFKNKQVFIEKVMLSVLIVNLLLPYILT